MSSTAIMSLLSIVMDVELGKDSSLRVWWQQRTNSVDELSMEPERVRPSTSVERVIQLATDRGHGKGIVVVANALAKVLASMLLGSEELEELKRRRLQRREGNLSLIAAHPKLGIEKGRLGQALIQPMKGPTMRAVNIEGTKVMNLPSRIKRQTCHGKLRRLHSIIRDVYHTLII
jgi:hypothetical protein